MFNEANLLERVDVWLERAPNLRAAGPGRRGTVPVGVANIDYDAKGQRLRIDYRNGASTTYGYDPLTFRLTQLLTSAMRRLPRRRPAAACRRLAGPRVQNLHYTYDPAGNITHIRDDAQQTIYFRNKRVEPSNDYTYDALYRLIKATGREHLGQAGGAESIDRTTMRCAWAPRSRRATARRWALYLERYVYDAVGNFLAMQHGAAIPRTPAGRAPTPIAEPSLLEGGKRSNRLTSTSVEPLNPEVYSLAATARRPRQHAAHAAPAGDAMGLHGPAADELAGRP